jgi:putative transposase
MPFVKIYIHLIWSTKNRQKTITPDLKSRLLNHIKENSFKKEIFIDSMNCVSDHIHILVSLGSNQQIDKVVQLLKGESSYWVNKQNLIKTKFEWQDEYIAVSVSESVLGRVREYITNQEKHHEMKTFQKEYDEFIKIYDFKNSSAKAGLKHSSDTTT